MESMAFEQVVASSTPDFCVCRVSGSPASSMTIQMGSWDAFRRCSQNLNNFDMTCLDTPKLKNSLSGKTGRSEHVMAKVLGISNRFYK